MGAKTMALKNFTHEEIRGIMNDRYQNKLAISFIQKYLYECISRNKKFIKMQDSQ
jgi:hypothetical protein